MQRDQMLMFGLTLPNLLKNRVIYSFVCFTLAVPLLSSCVIKDFKRQSTTKDPYAQYRAVPTAKAWETDSRNRPRYMTPDDILVVLYAERRHGPKGFIASGHDKRNLVDAVFRGVCESVMTINVTLKDGRTFDFAAYKKSSDVKYLPINKTLQAMRDVLKEQCPELSGFKINAMVLYKQAPVFEGTMLASQNWQMNKGIPKKGFGDDYRIKIAFKSGILERDGVMIDHNAKCEKEASLLIKRYFMNNTQRAYPQKLSMNDFTQLAKAATNQYVKECPNVEILRFRIEGNILPSGYECKKASECLMASKDRNWSITSEAIARRAPDAPRKKQCLTQTFCKYKGGDVLNAIYEGNFSHFQKLDAEYTKGYDDFLKSLRTGNQILDNMFKLKSIIHSVINEYMFQYKEISSSCLRSQFKTLVFKRRTSDIVLQNIYGVEVHRIPGADLESSYTVNKEFVSICRKVGTAVGGSGLLQEGGDAWLNKGKRNQVMNGVKEMMNKEPCNSPQIQQFEKNLLNFYQRIHN